MIEKAEVTVPFTGDELYQLTRLYDLLRDTDMIDDLPIEIETAFEKLQDAEVNAGFF